MSQAIVSQVEAIHTVTIEFTTAADRVLLAIRRNRNEPSKPFAVVNPAFQKSRSQETHGFAEIEYRPEPEFQLPSWLVMLDNEGVFSEFEDELSETVLIAYRSSHPALKNRPVYFNFFRRAWSVIPEDGPAIPLYVAGYPVHFWPNDSFIGFGGPYASGPYKLPFKLGPSTWPDDDTLRVVRETFWGSIGIRIMKAGYIDVIYEDRSAAKRGMCWHEEDQKYLTIEDPVTRLSSRIRFVIRPRRAPTLCGDQVCLSEETSSEHPAKTARGCIGAKILMDGRQLQYYSNI